MDLRPDEITGLIKNRIKNYNAKIPLGDVADGNDRAHVSELDFRVVVLDPVLYQTRYFIGA